MKNSLIISILFPYLIFHINAYAGEKKYPADIYDLNGRYIGSIYTDLPQINAHFSALSSSAVKLRNGTQMDIMAGVYVVAPRGYYAVDSSGISPGFGFQDVTASYLPVQEWNAGMIKTVDLNGDGRPDIVFSRSSPYCDSLVADYRPRLWIQTPQGTFVDETDARIPLVYTPTNCLVIFDADRDGNLDIFLGGYSCLTHHRLAALLINNGAGYFTDETSSRLPLLGDSSFVYFADAGPIDTGRSADLVVTRWNTLDTVQGMGINPVIWFNDGQGHFNPDTMKNLPNRDKYGFFEPFVADLNKDTMNDIVFANLNFFRTGPGGPEPLDTLIGQTAFYRNLGNGFFSDETPSRIPPPENRSTRTLAIADVDNDGSPDILEVGFLFGENNPQVRLFLNDGSGHFSVSAMGLPHLTGWFNGSKFGSLDEDGYPDLFMIKVAPGAPDYDVLLVNRGDGTFRDSSSLLPRNLDFSTSCALFNHQSNGNLDIAIGNAGAIGGEFGQNRLYHNTLSGLAWTKQKSGTDVKLNYIQVTDSATALAVGDSGTILKTTDSGARWILKASGTRENLNAVQFRGPETGYIAGKNVLLKTTDSGNSWKATSISGNFVSIGLVIPIFESVGDIYLGTDDGKLRHSINGNDTAWIERQFSGGKILGFRFGRGAFNGYSVTFATQYFTYYSPNEGQDWDSTAYAITVLDRIACADLSHDVQYLAGWEADKAPIPFVLRLDSTWTRLSVDPGPTILNDILAFNTSPVVYACGSYGRILKSTDSGNSWKRQISGTPQNLNAFSFINEGEGYAVGDSGTILVMSRGIPTPVNPLPPSQIPARYALYQNYPNPFNPNTIIHFQLPEESLVRLKVYNILGQEVKTLLDGVQEAGFKSVGWNANGAASGVYFYLLNATSTRDASKTFTLVRKAVLLR